MTRTLPPANDAAASAPAGDDADAEDPEGGAGDLSGRQRRHLRALGYDLKPTVSVGRAGISPPVLQSVEDAYNTSELIKARLERSCELDRRGAGRQLAAATGSHLVQVLGRTVLLYRANPDEPKIELPG